MLAVSSSKPHGAQREHQQGKPGGAQQHQAGGEADRARDRCGDDEAEIGSVQISCLASMPTV
jgi:hypothetical protein